MQLQRETAPSPHSVMQGSSYGAGTTELILTPNCSAVSGMVAPDITLAELKALLAKEKVTVGQSSISLFLHHLNLRFKKKFAGRPAGPTGRRRRT